MLLILKFMLPALGHIPNSDSSTDICPWVTPRTLACFGFSTYASFSTLDKNSLDPTDYHQDLVQLLFATYFSTSMPLTPPAPATSKNIKKGC